MKLVTYNTGTGPRCGILQDDSVIDATALLGAAQPLRDVQALLETGDDALDRVRAALEQGNSPAPVFALEDVRLQSPILRPPTIRDFMIFEEHATQQGTREREEAWYRMPIFYFSNPLCVYGPKTRCPILPRPTCWTMNWKSAASSARRVPTWPRPTPWITSRVS